LLTYQIARHLHSPDPVGLGADNVDVTTQGEAFREVEVGHRRVEKLFPHVRPAFGGFRLDGGVGFGRLAVRNLIEFEVVPGKERKHVPLGGERFFFGGAAPFGQRAELTNFLDDVRVDHAFLSPSGICSGPIT
jgi:hypothetical protein